MITALVQVDDLERLIKRQMKDPLLEQDAAALASFFRLCAAIAATREEAEASAEAIEYSKTHFKFMITGIENKMNAIKMIREIFSYGLKEAKDVVDQYETAVHTVEKDKKQWIIEMAKMAGVPIKEVS